jgi:hypothetical protein
MILHLNYIVIYRFHVRDGSSVIVRSYIFVAGWCPTQSFKPSSHTFHSLSGLDAQSSRIESIGQASKKSAFLFRRSHNAPSVFLILRNVSSVTSSVE